MSDDILLVAIWLYIDYWKQISTSTVIAPTLAFAVVEQNNKTECIIFRTTLLLKIKGYVKI